MRNFESKEWEYTLDKFSQLTSETQWLQRYRVSYYHQYIFFKTFNRIAYNYLLNIYLFLLHSFSMLKGSMFQRSRALQQDEAVFFISQNVTYLQHVAPVIERFETEGRKFVILCPGPEHHVVSNYLESNTKIDLSKLHCVESIGKKDFTVVFRWFLFPILFFADYLSLVCLRIKNILLIPADFAKFSLAKHIYEKRIDEWLSAVAVLISANDHWMWESLLHEKAKAKGIPNYIIQHGFAGDVFYPLIGSHICVWGDFHKRRMLEMEATENEVIVTGSGYFDKLHHHYAKISAEKKLITFMSQPYVKTPLRMGPGIYQQAVAWLNILEPLLKKYQLQLMIKLHPRDQAEFYPQLKNCSFTHQSLPEILSQTKIALTVDSTSILEASLFNLPVIQMRHPAFKRFFDLAKSGLSSLADSERQLFDLTENLLNDESAYRTAVEKTKAGQAQHFFRLGNSLDYLYEMIGNKQH